MSATSSYRSHTRVPTVLCVERRPFVLALVAAGLLWTGCGGTAATPIADGCTADATALVQTLAPAPQPVTLADGTPLSRCISDGTDDAELQAVGLAWSRAAEQLALTADRDTGAAARLGYLIGAARKGAARTEGVMSELVRRMESIAGGGLTDRSTPEARRALRDALAAGQATG